MRNVQILMFIFILLVFCQCKPRNMNINKNSTIEKEIFNPTNLIGWKLDTLREKEIELRYGFKVLDSILIKSNEKKEEIIIEKINNWEGPGDFHRIRIINNINEVTFFNIDGWIKIGEYETQYVPSFLEASLTNSNYIITQKSSYNDLLLFAFGYVYASKPGLLSIFNLSRFDKPELIFNDNFYLYNFKDENNDGNADIVITKFDKDEIKNNYDTITYLLKNGYY